MLLQAADGFFEGVQCLLCACIFFLEQGFRLLTGSTQLRHAAVAGGAVQAVHALEQGQAILLLGGDKAGGWNAWYEWAVPLADDPYDEYLRELGEEGLI